MSNRRIFEFNDGESSIFFDPSEVDYHINRLGIDDLIFTDRVKMIPMTADGSFDLESAAPEDVRLLEDTFKDVEPLIREAFGIPPFDRATGKGLLYAEVIELYSRFCDWRESLKKSMNPVQLSPESTDSIPPSPPGQPTVSSAITA